MIFLLFIVAGKTEKEHLTNLQKTLQHLKDSGFWLHEAKCSFMQTSINYLGHAIIDKDGIHLMTDKTEVIQNMPLPSERSEGA